MSYIFRGRLCGYICDECFEPLSGVKVRLYRTRREQDATALAAANPKDTFAILDEEGVRAKASSLIGEFDTDENGDFVADLGKNYDGGPIEVDVYCGTVPHRKPTPKGPAPLQFSITVVQPSWQPHGRDSIAIWDYCLSKRYWCRIRSHFFAWVICGRVTQCGTRRPAPQLKVSAFDVDWLQDDALGSAVTDATGHFRIDYSPTDFKKDIFGFNIELFGGPDLYFRVETLSGTVLLNEPPSRGRASDRENVSNCFCVQLCVEELPEVTHAWFTRVGDFALYSDINHLTDGLTTHAAPFGVPGSHAGPGYAFFGHMKLVGDCPKVYPGGSAPMRYRFLYEVLGSGGGLQPMNSANTLDAVVVGSRPITWDIDGTGPVVTSQPIYISPGGLTAPPGPTPPPSPLPAAGTPWGPIPPVILGPDDDGWITVDPLVNLGGFSGPLLSFASETAVAGGAAPAPAAGSPVTAANQKKGTMIRIVYEAEPTTGATASTPTLGNELQKIYINNWSDVNALNLLQFETSGNACTGLTTNLDIKYTADHEFMLGWGVGIDSAAAIPPHPPLPSGSTPRGGAGTHHIDITSWLPCSYRVTLGTQRKLTNGEQEDPGHTNLLTFCKK